jgi:hypothetical protein
MHDAVGRAMVRAVSRRPLNAEAWFQSQATSYRIYDGKRSPGKMFSPSKWGFPC